MRKSLYSIRFGLLLISIFILNNNKTKAQDQNFGYVAIGGGGYVCSVNESLVENLNGGNVYYAKTDVGGISRWNESTKDWTPLFSWVSPGQTSYLGTEAFAIDPASPNKLYSMGGTSYWNNGITALMSSTDYGNTWTCYDVTSQFKANGNGSDRQKGETLAVDPFNGANLMFGTRYNNGLFKSTNSGQSWSKVTTFPDSIGLKASFSFVQYDYNNQNTIFAGVFKTSNNIFVSKDGGATWKSIGGYPGGKPQRCCLSFNDQTLYVTYTSNGAVMKYKYGSDPANGTWTSITPATGRSYGGISVLQNSPNKIVTTTYNYWSNRQPWGWADCIYYSEDYGATWKEKASNCTMDNNGTWIHAAMHWIGCATMSQTKPGWVFVCSGNGIFATENIAAAIPTWKFMAKGLEEVVPVNQGMISIPGGPLISTVGDQGGYVHTDISKSPSGQISQSISMAFAAQKPYTIVRTVNATQPVNGRNVNTSVVLLSEDNGNSWSTLPYLPDTIQGATTSISADGSIILWKANSTNLGTRCYWTSNKGVTWNLSGLSFNATPVADPVNPQKFYVFNTANGYLYKSSNGGQTFTNTVYVGTGGSSKLEVALGNTGHIWINNNGKLKYSVDEGLSFATTSAYSVLAFSLGKAAPGVNYPTIYIWGKALSTSLEGMYRSIDKGVTWIRANDDAHQWGSLANAGTIEADENVYGRVFKSTAGMGIPWMGLSGFTALNDVVSNHINAELTPTVFNNSCTLKSNGANIKQINIYNLSAALVSSISTDIYKDETIEIGNGLQRGIYIVKVVDTTGTSTYKIVKQ